MYVILNWSLKKIFRIETKKQYLIQSPIKCKQYKLYWLGSIFWFVYLLKALTLWLLFSVKTSLLIIKIFTEIIPLYCFLFFPDAVCSDVPLIKGKMITENLEVVKWSCDYLVSKEFNLTKGICEAKRILNPYFWYFNLSSRSGYP